MNQRSVTSRLAAQITTGLANVGVNGDGKAAGGSWWRGRRAWTCKSKPRRKVPRRRGRQNHGGTYSPGKQGKEEEAKQMAHRCIRSSLSFIFCCYPVYKYGCLSRSFVCLIFFLVSVVGLQLLVSGNLLCFHEKFLVGLCGSIERRGGGSSYDWGMEKQTAAAASANPRKKSEFLSKIKSVCLVSSSADTGKGRSKLSSNKVTHGFHLVEGKSGHDMEDYHVAEYRRDKSHELGLFAIFDGHLGDGVPSYLKNNLFNNILREPNFWKDPHTAIQSAYRSTDKYILANPTTLGPGGSTAVTAIVIDGKDLWVANIGDSRAVVCELGCANQLTVDHEPHVERKRIEKQGGFVTILPGDVPRVNGQLAVARAFGDQSLKAHLSSEPDIRHVPIDSSIEFVILASDGLWKVMKNQEAVDLVKSIKDPQAAAKRLTTEALTRKSKDDISCIVIRFRC